MSMLELYLHDEAATLQLGRRLAQLIGAVGLIYICGDLGAGKTTFARGFMQGMGYCGRVKSPTYTLIEPYQVAERRVYHCDFYRIGQPQELHFIGIQEYINDQAICLIEWPERGAGVLPQPDLWLRLRVNDQGRQAVLESGSQRGTTWLEQLANDKF